jgi:hypothetical protein
MNKLLGNRSKLFPGVCLFLSWPLLILVISFSLLGSQLIDILSEHTGNDISSLWFSSLESLSRRSIVFTFLKTIWYQWRIMLYVSMHHFWRCIKHLHNKCIQVLCKNSVSSSQKHTLCLYHKERLLFLFSENHSKRPNAIYCQNSKFLFLNQLLASTYSNYSVVIN